MKLLTVLAAAVSFVTSAQLTNDAPAQNFKSDNSLIACFYYPLCDLDVQRPAPQPKDKTTDTQSKDKAIKLA